MPSGALGAALQVAHSGAVWGASFAWMGGLAAVTTALTPVWPWPASHRRLAAPGMALCLRFTLSEVEVIRHRDFDPERRSVFCQNHVNLMDAHAACAAIPHPFCGLMNWWHFKVPGYGRMMALARGIPVPPRRPGRYAEVAREARQRAREGLSILVFPEAHRTLDGEVGPFHTGVLRMAAEAGLPLVPLATSGMFEMMRKGSPLIRPSRLRLFLGPQVETAGWSAEALPRLAEALRAVVAAFARSGQVPEAQIAALRALRP